MNSERIHRRAVYRWGMRGAALLFALLLVLPFMGVEINPRVYGTASFLEVLWVVVNGAGVGFSIANLRRSQGEYREVCRELVPDQHEIIVAAGARRVDLIVLVKQTMYLLVGLVFVFTPPPAVQRVYTVVEAMTVLVFIGGSLMLTYLGFAANDDRAAFRLVSERRRRLQLQTARERRAVMGEIPTELLTRVLEGRGYIIIQRKET
jgi:hypothetical protein